jgi:hypothetical protein
MVRGAMTRLTAAVGVMAIAVALSFGAAPAQAAPKAPPKPTSIQITGKGLNGTLIVDPTDGSRLFDTLLAEVNWMQSAKPQTVAPAANKLGDKYKLTVMAKTVPLQDYELFPNAAGGPRAHRPSKQPSGNAADGWFYGRLTMSETLRLSGVPLKAKPDVVGGGIGGGIGENVNVDDLDPVKGVTGFLAHMRQLLLLNGAVLLVVLFGLAGIAFLIRRRV